MGLLLAATAAVSFAATVYTYDELNRLTKVVYGDGRSISYAYDAAGNLLTSAQTGANAWCGQRLTFAGNQLPSGWAQVKVRSGPGIVSDRLQGSPTDSGAEVGSPNGAPPAGTTRLVTTFRVATAYSYWGQNFGVQYQLANGRVWHIGLVHARYNHGDGNLVMTVQDLSNTWGSLISTGTVISQTKLPGYRHGLHDVTVTAQDSTMFVRFKNLDAPAINDINFTAALPSGFKIADVRRTLFHVYTTTDGSIWGDDVEWQCLNAPDAASGSVQVNARDPQGATLSLPNGVNSCTFNATGLWTYGAFPATSPDGVTSFNAVGYTRLLESANWFSLIAKIGTGYQSIGSSRTVAVNGATSIALLINEGIGLGDSYADNSGSLSVTYSCQ